MELGRILEVTRRWIWLLVLVPLLAGGITYRLVDSQPVVYTAQTELTVGPGIDNPTTDVNALKASAQYLQTFTQLAETRPILQKVVDELGLKSTGSLAGQVSVSSNPTTQVMAIEVTDTDRKRAIAIANSLANVLVTYSQTNTASDLDTAQIRSDLQQLNETSAGIETRIKELLSSLAEANNALTGPAIKAQQDKVERLRTSLSAAVDSALLKAIADRQVRISQLEAGLKSTTSVQAQQLILNELVREDTRLAADQSTAKDQQRFALDRLSEEQSTLAAMRNTNSQLVSQLTSELAVQRNRLADTQNTISDLYISLRNLATNQVKVINPAEAASADLPNTWLDVGVAMVAAFLLCLTLVLGIDYVTDPLRRPEDLAQATDVPLLAVIPKHAPVRRLGRDGILVNSMPESVASENLRVLSAKLFAVGGFHDLKGSPAGSSETGTARSFLFCSLDQGTDAVEIAANLALILVHSGRRVILCDANLRSTLATRLFEFAAQKGMTEALSAEPFDPTLVPVSWAPGLMLLPAGAHTTLAFELLASPRMLELNDWLITHADVVLYVGAPVKEFADNYALAPQVDEVILVTRQAKTRLKSIVTNIGSFRGVGANVAGIVLMQNRGNGIEIPASPKTDAAGRDSASKRKREPVAAPPTSPEPAPVTSEGRLGTREGAETPA